MSSGRRRVGSDEYERGYAHGRRDAEHDFQKLMARAVLWARPNGRPKRDRTALSQGTKREKRGPNRKLQQKRSAKPREHNVSPIAKLVLSRPRKPKPLP